MTGTKFDINMSFFDCNSQFFLDKLFFGEEIRLSSRKLDVHLSETFLAEQTFKLNA